MFKPVKRFKVGAVTRDLVEVQKWFDSVADANAYADACREAGCVAVYVRDFEN